MTDGAAVAAIDRLIGLGLDEDLDLVVIAEHIVDGIDQLADLLNGILGLCAEGAFAGEPENDVLRAQSVGDLDGALCSPHSELIVLFAVGGEAAVGGVRIHPETRSDKLCYEAVLVEGGLNILGIVNDLLLGHVVHVGNSVVIVELYAGESYLGELLELLFHGYGGADAGSESLNAFVYVPGAGGKSKSAHCVTSKLMLFI